jgi:hypothetical protein
MKTKVLSIFLILGLFYSTVFTIHSVKAALTYYKLYYDGFDSNGNPTFICQNCKLRFIDLKVSTAKTQLIGSITDVNVLVAFKCPSCGATYQLYVALHKFSSTNIAICIQRSDAEGAGGISKNWWNMTASLKP